MGTRQGSEGVGWGRKIKGWCNKTTLKDGQDLDKMVAWSRRYRTENNVAKGWRWEGSVGTRLKTGSASCAYQSQLALLAGFLVCICLGPII